jgi:hypothetical protein
MSQNLSHLLPGSLTPVINFFIRRIYLRIPQEFEMAPIGYSGPWGKQNYEKNRSLNLVLESL